MQPDQSNERNKRKITTEDPELANRFDRTLGSTVEAVEQAGIRYAFIGGIASGGLGRPRSTHDIDLFVMPEDAELALRALAKNGFETERTDPSWLYKAFKENILVDVIFKSKGEIYLDNEMYQRTITAEYHGRELKLVAPEDLLIIKAAAHSELCPNHWHDATALLSHASLDWAYLIRRARRAPRRILSLLLYAQSNDIGVPNPVIHELFSAIFGGPKPEALRAVTSTPQASPPRSLQVSAAAPQRREYVVAHLRECLAEDPRTNELDIHIDNDSDRILLRGEVSSADRRESVQQIAMECFPGIRVENQIRVTEFSEPAESEEMP